MSAMLGWRPILRWSQVALDPARKRRDPAGWEDYCASKLNLTLCALVRAASCQQRGSEDFVLGQSSRGIIASVKT